MGKKLKNMTDTNLLLTITIVVFFVMYIGAIVFQGKGFLKPQTFFNILNANAALIILSCGMSLVMITGGIDISVGGVVALVSMSCAVYLDFGGGNVFVSMLLAVAIGLAFGIVQGFLVAYLDIQPFIVTLAGMFFARGMTTIVNTKPFNVANESFTALKETRVIVPGMGSVNKLGNYVNAYVDQDGPQLLCGRRQQSERADVRYQCEENQVHVPSALRTVGRYRRLCVLPACRKRICFSCQRHGDERHCILHHRRYDADWWCRQYHRNLLRCIVPEHHPEHRIQCRSGSGMVDRYHHCSYAVSVPGGTERGDRQKKENAAEINKSSFLLLEEGEERNEKSVADVQPHSFSASKSNPLDIKGGKSYEKDEGKKTKDSEKTGMQPVPAADAAGTGTGSSGNSDPQHHILTSDQNESGRQCTDHTACNCG